MNGQVRKLKWVVSEVPTGRYRSFQKREWPTCYYEKGWKPAAFIRCDSEYRPDEIPGGNHLPLTVILCHHRHPEAGNSWKRLRMKTFFSTLALAKQAVKEYLAMHPEFAPLEK